MKSAPQRMAERLRTMAKEHSDEATQWLLETVDPMASQIASREANRYAACDAGADAILVLHSIKKNGLIVRKSDGSNYHLRPGVIRNAIEEEERKQRGWRAGGPQS